MNVTSTVKNEWMNEIEFGNIGAVLFMTTYIGIYGLGIICFFGQQLKETQQQRLELPAYFLKTLWDVPSKIKLYEELADMERLRHIYNCYFTDHESYMTINNEERHAIVEERAYECATRYREKLRRLHLSHTDYNLDTVKRSSDGGSDVQEQISKLLILPHKTMKTLSIDYSSRIDDDYDHHIMAVSVV
ncbi:unnamed protein product [Adineta steineri]|uniref:Uncharacterized protein n=1 Tax=Adineta steineri TaxID=433720 RepID=A0A813V213_9BILA|nr:unnamed protein product [Adineta steineri]CAF0754676.1 unnamed protein product [Adineta steineri]CAF0834866.1 unnamed protein product [Adineta steineri]